MPYKSRQTKSRSIPHQSIPSMLPSDPHSSLPIFRFFMPYPLLIRFVYSKRSLTICIIHDNTELTSLGLINFLKSYDVRVIKHFKNLSFSISCFLVFFTHLFNVNLLDHCKGLYRCQSILSPTPSEEHFTRKALP